MSDNRLLPVGSSVLEVAAARAAADIERVPVPLRTLWNWRTCPVRLLPYLAWAFSVDRWDEKWSETTKRSVIASAFYIHQHKGTIAALRRVVEPLGYLIQVKEWWESGEEPGTFRLVVGVLDIGAITWPVVAVAAAVVAGALLIRKYWEPISVFFAGVVEGLMSAFAPVGEMFAPLAPIFDGLGEKLRGVWQWFKDLIAPVKATQDTLNSCRDVGGMFGQALADALLMPLNAFNKLRSGIDWVLEKLGIINKESSSLDQTAAKANAATQNGYSPTISSYNSYQPVTAPAGKTYIDQSRPTYQITVPGNGMPGGRLGNDLQDALEKYEREKRAKARASMMHD